MDFTVGRPLPTLTRPGSAGSRGESLTGVAAVRKAGESLETAPCMAFSNSPLEGRMKWGAPVGVSESREGCFVFV